MSKRPKLPGILLRGTVDNVAKNPDWTDRKTGEVTDGRFFVQLGCWEILRNEEPRKYLVQCTTDDPEVYRELEGDLIQVAARPYVRFPKGSEDGKFGKPEMAFALLPGFKPESLESPL